MLDQFLGRQYISGLRNMSSIVCLQFATRYNTLYSMDLPELQIDDILRYLGEDDNQESAPFPPTPNVPTSSHQPSSPSTCRTTLNSRMATPFQGQRGSTKYTTAITPTRRGLPGTAVTSGDVRIGNAKERWGHYLTVTKCSKLPHTVPALHLPNQITSRYYQRTT